MASIAFDIVLQWLEVERNYQTEKFDYVEEVEKPVEYWEQQFASYIQRIPLFGLDTEQGAQATLKLAATAVALAEHYADKMKLPKPGVSSGEIEHWDEMYADSR